MKKTIIPIYEPFKAKNQKKYVIDCLNTNWISSKGKYIDKLEQAMAKFLGVEEAITVCNGSVSLILILYALDIGFDDEVIVPSLTYAATISSINLVGATAVLVDSDNNFQMNIEQVKSLITKRTKAIMVPELYGDAPDVLQLKKICKENSIYFIEDSAETFGCFIESSEHKAKKYMLGSIGHASSFSFFGNKSITCGEGGIVCTNDKVLANKMRLLKNQSHIGGFQHNGPGFNFRMTNIAAAIGLAQLEKFNYITQRKKVLAKYYRENLCSEITPIVPTVESAEWMPLFLLPENIAYIKFQTELTKYGIDSRPAFTPIHLMSGFKTQIKTSLLNSERIYKRGFNLPSYPDLTDKELTYIVNSVNSIIKSIGKN